MKILGATAVAGILYYSVPEGIDSDFRTIGMKLILLRSYGTL